MVRVMIRILAASLCLLCLAAPAAAAERRYTVTDFDRVEVQGGFQVKLVTGVPAGATATGSSEALERVSIEVLGRTLRVRPNRSSWGGYPGAATGPVSILLSTHELRGATVTGSAALTIDKARSMRVDLGLSGSGRLSVGNVEADLLEVTLIGGGRIVAAGKAKSLRLAVQGSGDVDAGALEADDAQIRADTAGNVRVGVVRSAKVNSTGAGEVEIVGKPACTVEAHGAGSVRCGR
jgi:hypothetical protein